MTQFKAKSQSQEAVMLLLSLQEKLESKLNEFKKLDATDQDKIDFLKGSLYTTFDGILEVNQNETNRSNVSMGLFNYPVLMACDILLYGAKYVPVGDDQTQHLEFTRDIAGRMNNKFGDLFEVPYEVSKQHELFNKGQGLRIMDLVDPTKKMSKSDETGKGVIFLTDTPEDAAKKIMSATTDDKASVNYNPVEQPGISNLLQILSLLRGQPLDEVEAEFKGMERYGDFKRVVADTLSDFLKEFQARLADVDDGMILAVFERSENIANDQANATLYRVQQAVGLRPRS